MLLDNQSFLQYSLDNRDKWTPFSYQLSNLLVHSSEEGIICFEPSDTNENTKSIVLSCGIHGNETAPIEICEQIVSDLHAQRITTKHRVLFIFGNLPSMLIAKRFVEENLNRLFNPDLTSDTLEGKRAKVLMQQLNDFFANGNPDKRFHYDLHTAIRPSINEKFAVYPYLHGKPYNKKQLAFLSDCDVNTILLSQSPTTTFSYYSSYHHNAEAFTVELGKVKPFGENDMQKFVKVDNMLRKLIQQQEVEVTPFEKCPLQIFTVNQVINKGQDDFRLCFDDAAPNFTSFKKGEVIATESGKEFVAQVDDEAIVFPNANVPIGQRAILTVKPYEL
ncbi:succinylglutamate desuccinylase [Glaciecola sp. 1036]|uniref:succinylglutamate desuccinylase n=1 Tax=Alteromonadaceae TaxID=72275 RepID=UPI003D036264